jgi:hypothetical protein
LEEDFSILETNAECLIVRLSALVFAKVLLEEEKNGAEEDADGRGRGRAPEPGLDFAGVAYNLFEVFETFERIEVRLLGAVGACFL